VHLSLFNTGTGIPAADLDRVFEQFYRVEKSRSAEYGGSGLGLSIVKRIIELHGGCIDMESEPSAWTRVNIFLP
jgi:two-component system OmpR family sensor kinase